MKKIAVIGAGIAGLSAARHLHEAGHEVVVWEKSRSLGGRCSSRAWEASVVDHGSQYFTLRDADFRSVIERLCPHDILSIDAPILTEKDMILPATSERFYHRLGNNRLGLALASGLDVRMECPIESLTANKTGWELRNEQFDSVILSLPWPQACSLLGFGDDFNTTFFPCLTAIFSYSLHWEGLPREVYAWSSRTDDLAWSACENHKTDRVNPGRSLFIAQASPTFSQHWLEAPPEEWSAELRRLLVDRWHISSAHAPVQFTHRWRYARIAQPVSPPPLPAGIYLTGDSYSESRVEAAWLAGRNTARTLLNA